MSNLHSQEQYQALYNWATISPKNLLASLALSSIGLFFMLGAVIVILVILALAFNNLTTTTKPKAAGMTLEAEGALLLAVVPLPTPGEMAAHEAQHLAVTLEGDQRVAIDSTLGRGQGDRGAHMFFSWPTRNSRQSRTSLQGHASRRRSKGRDDPRYATSHHLHPP